MQKNAVCDRLKFEVKGVVEMQITNVLNPTNTLSVNRLLAHKLGLNAAVVYAALVAKQAYYEARDMLDKDGYFYSTEDDLKESTSLSRAQQDRVIDILLEAGLIEFRVSGMPAKRCFRVVDAENLLTSLLETDNQVCEKAANKIAENPQTSLSESSKHTYKTKENKSKVSINQSADRIDGIDNKRENYLEIIRENIDYDCFAEKEKVDELVEIMVDVVCSTKDKVRVNGEDLPTEIVKNRFLKLDYSHIDYVLTALQKNTSEVRNIRAYLVTALYNAPATIGNYYSAWVNHDMYGSS